MYLSNAVLGSTAVRSLQERSVQSVLVIGSDKFDRADLSGVQCWNFIAAANLSRALAEVGAKNTSHLFEKIPPSALALPRIGAISLAVLGAAFQAKGLGGTTPLEAWVRKHTEHIITFYSIKKHEAAEQALERNEQKERKRKRRDQAHEIRVERHTKRNGNGSSNGASK